MAPIDAPRRPHVASETCSRRNAHSFRSCGTAYRNNTNGGDCAALRSSVEALQVLVFETTSAERRVQDVREAQVAGVMRQHAEETACRLNDMTQTQLDVQSKLADMMERLRTLEANFDDIELVGQEQVAEEDLADLEETVTDIDTRLYEHAAHVDRLDRKISLSITNMDRFQE